ncbi:MAG: hypothetical protein CMH85_13660 [Novosphingobium sp.]|uniref:hypothetical protein n=1 Tax=Novosphingobium naphthalenivorans TaxID=273168 RepID=UPI0008354F8D|nr:hypothetical protein [Novosphingobium naphthalenivorans]MAC59292.1 hypothetical protein [Novosphingobium sp.]
MDDERLDILLSGLASDPALRVAGADFRDGVWQRIGEIVEARQQRRQITISLAVVVIGLGTGFGVTHGPTYPQAPRYALVDGSDFAPSTLLHVAP